MELDFRNEKGGFLFSLKGKTAKEAFKVLSEMPELTKKVKKLKSGANGVFKEYVIYECITESCGYTIFGGIMFLLNKGGYIKIII